MDQNLFDKGLAQRKATLGADYVENNLAAADAFTRPFQEAMTAWCWGFGWGDPALDPKTRSMMTLAMIAALGKMHEWELHCHGAPEQWRHRRRNPCNHTCGGYLLRRSSGARMLPRSKNCV